MEKLKLEVEKLPLEILEKQRLLNISSQIDLAITEQAGKRMEDAEEQQVLNYILLRFIILYLIVIFWELVGNGIYYAAVSFLSLVGWIFHKDMFANPNWFVESLYTLIAFGPKIVYWAIILSIGIPLFRDINKFLKLDLRDVLRFRFPQNRDK